MFKVECPGCKAPYQVDERRVPSSGLKMRCPKCGTSFQVEAPDDPRRTGPSPVLGEAPPPRKDPRAPLKNPAARTMVGVAPSALGLPLPGAKPPAAPAAPPAPARPPLPAPQPPAAPKAAPPRPPPRVAAPGPPPPQDPYADADLPAIGARSDVNLPAPAGRPKPPPPVRGQAPAAPPKSPSTLPPDDVNMLDDLPAVPGGSGLDIDLPSPAPPAALSVAGPSQGADLPALAGDLEWGLPDIGQRADRGAPAASVPAPTMELDLPDLPDLDFPAPQGDLPSPAGAGLPSAARGPGLPAASAGLPAASAGLPAVSAGLPSASAGLPASSAGLPASSAGLPSASAGLPSASAGLPSASAGVPSRAPGLPANHPGGGASSPGFGELDLDLTPGAPSGAPPLLDLGARQPSVAPPTSGGFGEIDLPPRASGQPMAMPSARPSPQPFDPLEADPFGEAAIPSQRPMVEARRSAPPAEVVGSQVGGTSYGEVNLDGEGDGGGSGGEVPLEGAPIRSGAAREEDMEFGALPEQRPPGAMKADVGPAVPAARRRWPLRVFAGLLVLAVGGGSLAFVPGAGPYGAYFISDRLHAAEYGRLLGDAQRAARARLGHDIWPEAVQASVNVDATHEKAKRFYPLATYAAFTGYLRELRFGSDPAAHARGQVLLAEIGDAKDVPYLDFAVTARDALDGQLTRALESARSLSQRHPNDPDALALLGEVALRGADPAAAKSPWQALEKLEHSARSAFGIARASYVTGDMTAAAAAARQALERTPGHVGARVLLARIDSFGRGNEARSLQEIADLLKSAGRASPDEVVSAQTLLGEIHLGRSQVALAEVAFDRALKINPSAARALAGLGEALFRSRRFSEALARFESASQADPRALEAKIGVAKSKLSLERVEDALRTLAKLEKENPKSLAVSLWYGRAADAAGDHDRAAAIYRRALDKGSTDPELVDIYVALAMLENERGETARAQQTLVRAKAKLPESVALHRSLGDLALLQGRNTEAIAEYRRALELDGEDLGARFQLGIALRRNRGYDEATKVLDEVAKEDPDHPGLALERGLIFEATGQGQKALDSYESALAKAPTDPDLMLRVGCGRVSAGQPEKAEELLRKVLGLKPNSAEVNHCLGRSLLARDKVADAQRLLDRAVEIDPKRAEYHLYAGWAANEAGNVPKAERELARALEIDGSLADAYWQRGVLRARQGAVKDAVTDLTRALTLSPGRVEAHAALADAYYDLGKERDALAEWQKAVQAQPDNAVWHFRYGKLLVTNQMMDVGREHLERAIRAGEKSEAPPRWLWEAHHIMARSLAGRAEAAPHWEAFLRLGPRDSPYRTEAKAALVKLGKPWTGE